MMQSENSAQKSYKMTGSLRRGDPLEHPCVADALIRARELQLERFNAAFVGGWSLNKNFCRKYHDRYLALAGFSRDERDNAYQTFFDSFALEVGVLGGFPSNFNSLDHATLFGEVCAGEYKGV